MEKDKKSEIHITNNFNAPIGQHINHVDTINFRMDGDGNFQFGMVENVNKGNKQISDKQLAKAIENCQESFWGHSSYAVVFCLCRDECNMTMTQAGFEKMVEMLPYTKNRDYTCNTGTIANAFSDNPIFKYHVSKWEENGAAPRILKLLNHLRTELEL